MVSRPSYSNSLLILEEIRGKLCCHFNQTLVYLFTLLSSCELYWKSSYLSVISFIKIVPSYNYWSLALVRILITFEINSKLFRAFGFNFSAVEYVPSKYHSCIGPSVYLGPVINILTLQRTLVASLTWMEGELMLPIIMNDW